MQQATTSGQDDPDLQRAGNSACARCMDEPRLARGSSSGSSSSSSSSAITSATSDGGDGGDRNSGAKPANMGTGAHRSHLLAMARHPVINQALKKPTPNHGTQQAQVAVSPPLCLPIPHAARVAAGGAGLDGAVPSTMSSSRRAAHDNPPAAAWSEPPRLALLQAAPLVHNGRPVEQLDMKAERDAVFSALKSSGKQAHATSDFCTTRRLRDVLTAGCRILHCSGHGFSYLDQSGRQQSRLAFEDGEGGTHALEVSNLLALIWAGAEGDERPPLDLAFVSACHGGPYGEAFAAAGVPHVVAVRRQEQLQDKAACLFAEQFYHALFMGRSVKQAFTIGKQAVANQPHIVRPGEEAHKFMLLPVDGDHSEVLLRNLPPGQLKWVSPPRCAHNLPAFRPLQFIGRQVEWQRLVAAACGSQKRLLHLIGEAGTGKTSLTLAAAHYVLERGTFAGGILYVSAAGATSIAALSRLIVAAVAEANRGSGRAGEEDEPTGSSNDELPFALLRHRGACLLIIDEWTMPCDSTVLSSALWVRALGSLLERAPDLRVLLSGTHSLALPGVARLELGLMAMPDGDVARLFKVRPDAVAHVHAPLC